eukprot:scaffold74513_cov20-Tisochrysis_lutea.AAC.1
MGAWQSVPALNRGVSAAVHLAQHQLTFVCACWPLRGPLLLLQGVTPCGCAFAGCCHTSLQTITCLTQHHLIHLSTCRPSLALHSITSYTCAFAGHHLPYTASPHTPVHLQAITHEIGGHGCSSDPSEGQGKKGKMGLAEIVHLLVACGANIDGCNAMGRTPLILSAMKPHRCV